MPKRKTPTKPPPKPEPSLFDPSRNRFADILCRAIEYRASRAKPKPQTTG